MTAGPSNSACRVVGEFLQAQSRTVSLVSGGASSTYDLEAAQRVEVSQGMRSYRVIGAVAGLVIGTGVTYIVLNQGGSTSYCDRSANQDALGSGECLGLVVLGGVAGAGLGAVVGGFIRAERWGDIPLERLRVGVMPGKGVGVRVLMTW